MHSLAIYIVTFRLGRDQFLYVTWLVEDRDLQNFYALDRSAVEIAEQNVIDR